jgi:hypothetical protein
VQCAFDLEDLCCPRCLHAVRKEGKENNWLPNFATHLALSKHQQRAFCARAPDGEGTDLSQAQLQTLACHVLDFGEVLVEAWQRKKVAVVGAEGFLRGVVEARGLAQAGEGVPEQLPPRATRRDAELAELLPRATRRDRVAAWQAVTEEDPDLADFIAPAGSDPSPPEVTQWLRAARVGGRARDAGARRGEALQRLEAAAAEGKEAAEAAADAAEADWPRLTAQLRQAMVAEEATLGPEGLAQVAEATAEGWLEEAAAEEAEPWVLEEETLAPGARPPSGAAGKAERRRLRLEMLEEMSVSSGGWTTEEEEAGAGAGEEEAEAELWEEARAWMAEAEAAEGEAAAVLLEGAPAAAVAAPAAAVAVPAPGPSDLQAVAKAAAKEVLAQLRIKKKPTKVKRHAREAVSESMGESSRANNADAALD